MCWRRFCISLLFVGLLRDVRSTILGFRLRSTVYAQKMPVGNIFLGRDVCVKYLPMFRTSYCCHLQCEVILQCLEGVGDEKKSRLSVIQFTSVWHNH